MFGKSRFDEMGQQLKAIVDTQSKISMNMEKISIEHKVLSEDQTSLGKRLDCAEGEIRTFQNLSAKVDMFVKLIQWGGLALISAIMFSWNSMSNKIDVTEKKTDTNTLAITANDRNDEDDQKQLDELKSRTAKNREDILIALRKHDASTGGARSEYVE